MQRIYNLEITLWSQLIVNHWTCIHVLLTWTMDKAYVAFYTSVLTLSKELKTKIAEYRKSPVIHVH